MFTRLKAFHKQLVTSSSRDRSVEADRRGHQSRLSTRTSEDSGLNVNAGSNVFLSTASLAASWPGISRINNLIIFGDSYSDITQHRYTPRPTLENPLGVPWPGATFAEAGEPNWVGHFLTNYSNNPKMLVFDYAEGGATLDDVEDQVTDQFQKQLVLNRAEYPWSGEDSLFVTWVGINDCAYKLSVEKRMTEYYGIQHKLYEAGARNFLFINVPPMHKSPAWNNSDTPPTKILAWNNKLQEVADFFQANHADASVLLFSAWDTFMAILDEPAKHGFSSSDPGAAGGGIWVDRLHPTSRVHDYVARDVARFLKAQEVEHSGEPSGQREE